MERGHEVSNVTGYMKGEQVSLPFRRRIIYVFAVSSLTLLGTS
jgi:hypothetical protein